MLDFFFSDRCFDDARVHEFFSGGFDELLLLTLGSSSFWIEKVGFFNMKKRTLGSLILQSPNSIQQKTNGNGNFLLDKIIEHTKMNTQESIAQ